MEPPTVHILLATFNGERYLNAFLHSLRTQTHPDWHLHVRDDGSDDGTLGIVTRAMESDPRISLIRDRRGRLGSTQNFAELLNEVAGRFYMFADQDDVWLPDKIARSLGELEACARRVGHDVPILVFTDLQVVDADLNTLHASDLRRHGFDRMTSRGLTVRRLVTQNIAAGCSMLFNRALRDAALPIPAESVMHDWWMMLVAASVGRVVWCDVPTVLYRQHDQNQIGAAGPLARALAVLRTGAGAFRRRQVQALAQASALLRRYGDRMSPTDRDACRVLADLHSLPRPLRQLRAAQAGIRRWGWMRTLAFYLFL